MEASNELTARCRREVEELHEFFEQWFLGKLEATDENFGRFADVMHEQFEIVAPDGTRTPRESLLRRLRQAHGFQAGQSETYRIRVENVAVRDAAERVHIVTYEEWQRTGAGDKGRISTAVMRDREGRPNGLEWLHVHETWMPEG